MGMIHLLKRKKKVFYTLGSHHFFLNYLILRVSETKDTRKIYITVIHGDDIIKWKKKVPRRWIIFKLFKWQRVLAFLKNERILRFRNGVDNRTDRKDVEIKLLHRDNLKLNTVLLYRSSDVCNKLGFTYCWVIIFLCF